MGRNARPRRAVVNLTSPFSGATMSAITETAAPETAAPAKAASPSEARVRANRLNAQKSTGARTPEGKKRSSLNATRHGLLAQTLHLPEEEMSAYHEFTVAYVKDLNAV